MISHMISNDYRLVEKRGGGKRGGEEETVMTEKESERRRDRVTDWEKETEKDRGEKMNEIKD